MDNLKVAIIGMGILGTVHKDWLVRNTPHEVMCYDTDETKSNSTLEEIAARANFVFICVPTDAKDGLLDTSLIYSTITAITGQDFPDKKIIIRSTVPVGYCSVIMEEIASTGNELFYIPEFLTEKTAKQDFENAEQCVIGSKSQDATILNEVFPLPWGYKSVKFEVAETIKLATNAFYATKIIFANELKTFADVWGIYEDVKEFMSFNPRIGSLGNDNQGRDVHLRVAPGGVPGFGGKCLPKDIQCLATQMKENNAGFGLLDKVIEINNTIPAHAFEQS